MKKTPQEIRFAVFGAKESGKTTMLSAYYGSQQTESFMKKYGYQLSADSTEDGNTLLSRFYQLEEGQAYVKKALPLFEMSYSAS